MRSGLLLAITALPFLGADALKVSTTARCGTQSKSTLTCKGSVFGNCCSKSGYCGSTSAYCGTGCQTGFGDCKSSQSTSAKSSSASTKLFSTSTKSPISSTSSARVIAVTVNTSSAVSTPPATSTLFTTTATASPIGGVKVSTDGTCGASNGFTCVGSGFGNCCSEYGWCGSTSLHCDAGCNAAFGICGSTSTPIQPSSSIRVSSSSAPSSFVTSTRTSAVPTPTVIVSKDGSCGASNGLTCQGSSFGDCCSQYGYCGASGAFCGTGCQAGFGKCDTAPAPGKTCNVEGFANKAEYYASSFNLIDTTDVSTCAKLCLAEATCQSYLWNPLLGNCAYLTYSLAQGEFIADPETDQFFWDRACAEATAA